MAFDNTKYHCEINSVPYMIRGYNKSELSTFIPRLGSGDQTESEFDLLRSKTINGFTGGSLQRFWDTDNTSVFASEGLYPVYDDGVLYPVNSPVTATNIFNTAKAIMTAYCVTPDYVYFAVRTFTSPTNVIRRLDKSGTLTTLTLPASLTNSTEVTSMVVWNDQLWVATGTTSMWYMALSSTTLIDITGGTSGYLTRLVVFGGQLYGTSGTNQNRKIIRYTGTTASKAFVEVADTGQNDSDATAQFFLYNNRIILTRKDGMYAYDGVRMVTLESAEVSTKNYRFCTVLKGYLYYFMPDGMYRFNGSLIEKLYDISEIGTPVDAFKAKDRIWLIYTNSQFSGSSRYDKSMGYDLSGVPYVSDGRIMVFNGKGLYTYARTPTYTQTGTPDVGEQGEVWKGFLFNDKLYITTYYENIYGNQYYTIDTNEQAATGNKSWRLVSSIFDSDFPMVDKNLENIELTFDGNVSSDQDITLEYRIGGFDGSTGWTALGTIKSQTRLKDAVFRTLPDGVVFKRIQFRLSGTTATSYGMAKLIIRYTLTPDVKLQWSFTANCYGDDLYAPLQLVDDSDGSQLVSLLRGNIYDARMRDVPFKFLDIDQFDLNGAINSSVATVTLNSTSMLKDYGFVQIDDEIIYYAAKTSTTLTGCIRAMMGTSAASHSDNAKVFAVYRTIIRQIKGENIELTKSEIDIQENKSRSSEITLLLQEV